MGRGAPGLREACVYGNRPAMLRGSILCIRVPDTHTQITPCRDASVHSCVWGGGAKKMRIHNKKPWKGRQLEF